MTIRDRLLSVVKDPLFKADGNVSTIMEINNIRRLYTKPFRYCGLIFFTAIRFLLDIDVRDGL